MKIKWQAEDGYCGGARPQHVEIDDEEIQNCESVEEALELIEEVIEQDFVEKISWSWEKDKSRAEVEKLLAEKTAVENEE